MECHAGCHTVKNLHRLLEFNGNDLNDIVITHKGLHWNFLNLRDHNGPRGKLKGLKRVFNIFSIVYEDEIKSLYIEVILHLKYFY